MHNIPITCADEAVACLSRAFSEPRDPNPKSFDKDHPIRAAQRMLGLIDDGFLGSMAYRKLKSIVKSYRANWPLPVHMSHDPLRRWSDLPSLE
jgi:hypothetical protein